MSSSRAWRLVPIAAVLLSAVLAVARFHSFQVGGYYDDAHYVVLSESLAQGRGMRLVSYPEAPPEWAFPPGLPLMLAPLSALFPGNYDALKLVSLACWLLSIPLVWFLARDRLAAPWRELLTLLVALHPALVATSGMVMSEAPYLFFSLLALTLFEAWSERGQGRARWGLLLAAAAAAVWAQQVRTVGTALLIALLAAPLLRRRWRDAVRVAGALALCLLPQLAWGLAGGGALLSPGYRFHILDGSPATHLAHMAANAASYTVILPDLLLPLFGPRLAPALAAAGLGWVATAVRWALLLGVAGGLATLLHRPRALELYALAYLPAVLTFWNPVLESAQERYLLPLLPFFYLCLLRIPDSLFLHAGQQRAAEAPAGTRRQGFALALASLLLLLFVLRNVQDAVHPVREAMTDLAAGAGWIAAHAPAGAVVMSKNPVQDYLYARRRTVGYPDDASDLAATVAARSVDYVLVAPRLARTRERQLDPYVSRQLLPALLARPDLYSQVFRDPRANTTVFAVRRSVFKPPP